MLVIVFPKYKTRNLSNFGGFKAEMADFIGIFLIIVTKYKEIMVLKNEYL